ncbi:ATP-binding cassette domain-containing protein [Agromyces sp. NPDC004153]
MTGLKGFDGAPLFSDLSFDLQRGDRVAVLGSNGSGKSTLLDVLTGETEADAGTVRWAKGVRLVSYNAVFAAIDLTDTVGTR